MRFFDVFRRRDNVCTLARYVFLVPDFGKCPTGGIMNLVRHCALVRKLGAESVLATESGNDAHAKTWFHHDLPCIKWRRRRLADVCVIPDVFTDRVNAAQGACIVYMQNPNLVFGNFDYGRSDVRIWVDSPLMLDTCRQVYPGKDIVIAPNIVDKEAFPFIPQSQRKDGMIIVFPRKGAEFIKEVFAAYERAGGKYWRSKVVDGLPHHEMALVFREAQAFLASADVEGCALPPQESMAAGVIVVGKDASGANFCMQHGKTALVGNTVAEVVHHLFDLESALLRETLAAAAHEFISRYFPDAEPTEFWKDVLAGRPAPGVTKC